jgi:hypothetical protein
MSDKQRSGSYIKQEIFILRKAFRMIFTFLAQYNAPKLLTGKRKLSAEHMVVEFESQFDRRIKLTWINIFFIA